MTDLRKYLLSAWDEEEKNLEKEVRVTALQVYRNIVLGTPVGNPALWKNPEAAPEGYIGGSARQSWNIDLNIVDTKITKATTEPGAGYDGGEKALSATARFKLKDTFYISNHLPYIDRLNDGWSQQAPELFVEAGIDVGVRQAEEMSGKK